MADLEVTLDDPQYNCAGTPRQIMLFDLYRRYLGEKRASLDDAKAAVAFAEYVLNHIELLPKG
jgi:hypothetical protein